MGVACHVYLCIHDMQLASRITLEYASRMTSCIMHTHDAPTTPNRARAERAQQQQ